MPTLSPNPRVCVIGAGISGLTSVKALLDLNLTSDRNLSCTCYEASDRVGGLWAFGNAGGNSAAYRSLFINTSRDRMQLRDFPMPREYPDYPHHELIGRYLRAYAEQFQLQRSIRLNTRVTRVGPNPSGGFSVTTCPSRKTSDSEARKGGAPPPATSPDTTTEHFDAVIVANGHHFSPRFPRPAPKGAFAGTTLHSHSYVDPQNPCDLSGKRVIVVGFGNSAVDIACELAREPARAQVYLSVRRGAWVLPRYALGRPLDQVTLGSGLLPRAITQPLAELWYRVAIGDVTRFGLPQPDHGLGDAHPTMSDELLPMIGKGRIVAKPQIDRYEGNDVVFADGSRESIDAIVFATGYDVSFPFFESSFVSAPDNELPLYLHVFAPEISGLYFVGLCQPLGPIFPLAEAQAKLIARHVAGHYSLPSVEQMRRATQRERALMRRRFGSSARHTMQVDFDTYLSSLNRELERSA
ncbi:MAG TPA: NAD(P)-binding domain-containing protein [Polyangiaceae bacterium]|nr:NAD(P)-binding domain-containing protein [Polyangiaceae bacterium]